MQSTDFDKFIGIEIYTTKAPGIGGRLRRHLEDFVVQEIGIDGDVAPLKPASKDYPDQPGKFIAFFLVKRNIDSIQAIRRISRALGISYKRFSYAGIKDRRAVSSQRITLYRGDPHDLIGREIPNIQLLHPHRVQKPILPGQLFGNHFTIIIRDLDVTGKEVVNRITAIQQEYEKQSGIINFFGHQRFGVTQPTTHLIGKQILLGNLQEAIHILLDISRIDDPSSKEDNENSLERTETQRHTKYRTYERAISNYLAKHPGDYKGSLSVLPKDLVRLYIHAYQAFLFNKALSQRAKRGIQLNNPTVGDFTMPTTGEIHATRMVTTATLPQTEEDIKNGLRKLVIPIIGYDFEHIEFEGPMGEIITKILEEEQISPNMFRLKHLPAFNSRGTFRPILIQPNNFQFSKINEEAETAVRFSFDLKKGSYASVVLREFIKPKYPTQL
ncbi:MAG: tRNA pseudouridine(13) synthase TruD [Promethearchaeota archaeon]